MGPEFTLSLITHPSLTHPWKRILRMFNKLKALSFPKITRRERIRKSLSAQRRTWSLENLEERIALTVQTFQEGAGLYTGTQDTVLYSQLPGVNFGTETSISVDQQDVGGVRQGLLKFDSIFTSTNEPGKIPLGSTINSASLRMRVGNDSNAAMQMSFYRMLTDWNEGTASWNSFGQVGGISAFEGEVRGLPPDSILFDSRTGPQTLDVTKSLRHWASGEANFGWLIESATTNGWDFDTSEAAPADRPLLTVDFTPPSGAGTFEFLTLNPSTTEGNAGSSVASLPVARLGGSTGTVTVHYTIATGTTNGATAGDDFTATTGQLTFGPGETVKEIPVTIFGDTALEGFETISVTLSNPTSGSAIKSGAGSATLSIDDDDALINEVLANISSSTLDETNREYIELIGTHGASLNGYQFVVFESEEEEGTGGIGVVDFVIDLAGQTFGSNGLLVITPTNWAYTKDAATNQLTTALLDGAGGKLEDSSQTYALIRGGSLLTVGTDYDTVGAYLTTAATAVENIPGEVGKLDQLPAGAQYIDHVGVNEGGGGDRDRTVNVTGSPGAHVHQPDGINSSNTTSDAVSRRVGQRDPNSIGVWFNGDITDAVTGKYRTDANNPTAASVVSPAGAVITPGAPNILRNVGLEVKAITVDEAAGTVSVKVLRTGDLSGTITVGYTTANGTAVAGLDFTTPAPGSTLTFGDQVSEQTITIPITVDSVSEGFETFTILLTSSTSPYQIVAASTVVTVRDGNVLTKTFQEGVNGYTGVRDSTLNSRLPTSGLGAPGVAATIVVDEQLGAFTGVDARPAQGLLAFNDLFGSGPDQVPAGAQIFGGFITVDVVNATASNSEVRLFRMLQNWDEDTASWVDPQGTVGDNLLNGVTPDDVEATAEPDAIVTTPGLRGLVDIPLDINTLQAWANGTLENFGWSIISDSSLDWTFASADYFGAEARQTPKLTILYNNPTGPGSFRFSDEGFTVNENGTATIAVERVGGTAGAATLNWSIAAGTGNLSDITGPSTGTVSFSGSEISKTFTIPINNDTALERNETLLLSLTGTGVTIDRAAATLTIRDNDFNTASPSVLLNEFFINSPGNDGGSEFAELAGTAGSAMGSLYFVAIDGDSGQFEGVGDLVVDLGAFQNGSSGYTVIGAANDFDFSVPSDTTKVNVAAMNVEALANDSATYALIYSPNTNLALGNFDYDWDNNGTLELPAGAVFIDSVAIKDGGALDRSYFPGSTALVNPNDVNAFSVGSAVVVHDAISRVRGNTVINSGAAWFGGDLLGNGDDPAGYLAANSQGLPVTGAALSPGEINTAASSPLVALTSVVPNNPVGTVTVNFNGPVSQVLDGNFSFTGANGTGITITNTSGTAVAGVDTSPVIAGLFTNSLTLSFTGSAVTGGQLPAGTYRLNFAGNSIIGNGRVVDVANNGTQFGGSSTFTFTKTVTNPIGDYNNNGSVDAADYTVYRDSLGTAFALPNRAPANTGNVSQADYDTWVANFGQSASSSIAAAVAGAVPTSAAAIDAALADIAVADEGLIAASPRRRSSFTPTMNAAASPVSDRFELLLSARQAAASSETSDAADDCDRPKPAKAETPASGLRQVLRRALSRVS